MNKQAAFFEVNPPSERDYAGRGVVYFAVDKPSELLEFAPVEEWSRVIGELRGGGYADWLGNNWGAPLLSQAVVDLLVVAATGRDRLEWLVADVVLDGEVREYQLLHFPLDLDPLNREATRWINDRYPRVPVIRQEFCGQHSVFALRQTAYGLVVSADVKRQPAAAFPRTFSFRPVDVA